MKKILILASVAAVLALVTHVLVVAGSFGRLAIGSMALLVAPKFIRFAFHEGLLSVRWFTFCGLKKLLSIDRTPWWQGCEFIIASVVAWACFSTGHYPFALGATFLMVTTGVGFVYQTTRRRA